MLLKIRVSVTVVIFSISTNSPTYKITMEKIVILEIVLVGTVIVGGLPTTEWPDIKPKR